MSIKTVAIFGATGSLGTKVLDAVLAAGEFEVTVIKRQGSTSNTSGSQPVRVVEVQDGWNVEDLQPKLKGQDCVIVCLRIRGVEEHLRLADAAAAAGVKRFIPADFGSVDARSPYARELVKLFDRKVAVREKLEALSAQSGNTFTWTSLVVGHFFDWGLTNNFLHFNLAKKSAEILGDGTQKSSNSTTGQVAKAVVQILRKPEETANRVLLIQSFCVSQLDILRSLEKATDTKWSVEYVDTEHFVAKHKALADSGNKESIEDLVFALGVIEGNWEDKDDFAMDLLGLQNEDLDEVVKQIVGSVQE
jgi:nucleoside-diphosphate-sugar epimerase